MPQRYEREIEEILRRMNVASLDRAAQRRAVGRSWERLFQALIQAASAVQPSHLMVAGIVLAMMSYLLGRLMPGVVSWLGLLSLLLFVGAIALSVLRNSRRSRFHPGWRGRTLEVERGGAFWASWVRRYREWRLRRRWRGPRI